MWSKEEWQNSEKGDDSVNEIKKKNKEKVLSIISRIHAHIYLYSTHSNFSIITLQCYYTIYAVGDHENNYYDDERWWVCVHIYIF